MSRNDRKIISRELQALYKRRLATALAPQGATELSLSRMQLRIMLLQAERADTVNRGLYWARTAHA